MDRRCSIHNSRLSGHRTRCRRAGRLHLDNRVLRSAFPTKEEEEEPPQKIDVGRLIIHVYELHIPSMSHVRVSVFFSVLVDFVLVKLVFVTCFFFLYSDACDASF